MAPSRFFRMLSGGICSAMLCSCIGSVPAAESTAAPASSPTDFPSPTPTSTSSPTPFTAETLPPAASPEPTSTPATLDRPSYRIRAELDARTVSRDGGDRMTLTVEEEAFYTNRSADTIPELALQFEPSRQADLFKLIRLSAERMAPGTATIANGQLRIPLDPPLSPGESTSLRLEYLRYLAHDLSLIGWNDYQIVLGNWYAFFPPYREGRGWLIYSPGPVGEYLNFPYADFDVQLGLAGADAYRVAASGIPEEGQTPLRFRFTGRSFALALTTQNSYVRDAGGVEVIGYAQPQYEVEGGFMTDVAARAVQFYGGRYGGYPHRRLTVLESELPDGMEFDGLVFINPELFPFYTGSGADYLTAITAHEAAHQWWYGRVGNDQAMEPWLDEAFAVYSELLFYEKYYPQHLDWWWWTRVDRYASDQCVDLPVYSLPTFRSYVDTVYLRGAKMLHALRLQMGTENFLDGLRDLQDTYQGSLMTSADVFRTFQSHSDKPLSGIWGEYLCQAVPAEEP